MAEMEELKKQIAALQAEVKATSSRQVTPAQSVLPQIPLPGPPNIKEGDISENLRHFKQQWENYLTATGIGNQQEETKKAILLTALGDDVFKRYANMPIIESSTTTASLLLNEIEKHLTPTINKRYIRAIFNMANQGQEESYDEYFNRLRGLIKNAQYGQLQNDLLLDKVICSIKDHDLREKLWLDSNITLERAIEICRSKETTEKQLKSMENKPIEINKIQKKEKKEPTKKKPLGRENCRYCGMEYHDSLQQCRARNSICKSCNKKGHWAKVCLSKSAKYSKNGKSVKATDNTSETSESEEEEEFVLQTFDTNKDEKGLYVKINIINSNNKVHYTKCQLDTGATCNLIGIKDLKKIEGTPIITKTSTKLKIVEGPQIIPIGKT